MGATLRVLVVEDSEDDTRLLLRRLRQGGYEASFRRVETAEAMRSALAEETWDLVVADYSMPRFSGVDALAVLHETGQDIPFIILSGTIGEEIAVAAMKAGAHDYLRKDDTARLLPAIDRELREAQGRRAGREAERKLREAEAEKKRFYREVVRAITGGRLILEERGELALDCNAEALPIASPEDIRRARQRARERALAAGMDPLRADDLELAVGEAAANAWKHAGSGAASICLLPQLIRVVVQDHGTGIDADHLARAAFEKGYSTAQTLGMGFSLMLSLSDRVRLVTDPLGTTIAIETLLSEPAGQDAAGDAEKAEHPARSSAFDPRKEACH